MIDLNADCVRRIANWSVIKPYAKFEKNTFDTERLRAEMQLSSPKIYELLRKIQEIDQADLEKEGKLYKHFIFSDVKQGGYGSKVLASSLIASGLHLVYNNRLELDSDEQLRQTTGKNFALLCSTGVYDKTISVKLKKNILAKYNQRPENINGDLIRFIVMDSGYKEGIDLFDVKYVHILEPQTSKADEKQVIGRGTRTCGQKGLQFQPNAGWPLEVYVYDVEIPSDIAEMLDAKTLFQLYVKHSNIDVRKIAFANSLERMAIVGSVDYELNKNIHDFSVRGEEVDINKIFDGSLNAQKGGAVEGFCTAKCGARATKHVPLSTLKFAAAFFALGNKLPQRFKTTRELREYFCGLMKTDEDFCATLHDLNEDINKFIAKHAEELMMSLKNKDHMILPKKYAGYYRAFVYTFLPKDGKILVKIESPKPLSPDSHDPLSPDSHDPYKPTPKSPSPSPESTKSAKKQNKGFLETREYIRANFKDYKWPKVELQNMCGGSTVLNLNPTQRFVSDYFTPENPLKGILLYHSVGTGKSCSAIATATSSFEKAKYTILWVTRTTLKSDIWKNMFDQVCSAPIRAMIEAGKKIPTEQNDRMRLLSDSWSIRPMSYKQFSNLVEGKNELYKALVKKNGAEDPLRRTLLIIDEAHKLYGGTDLSSVERPNMFKLKKAVHQSYSKSGADSVKVILMTATPYTNDPMELVKLVNLLKPKNDQIPDEFDAFAEKYLDDNGSFTKKGNLAFLNDIAGYISYLNREKDARQFAQPIVMQVRVPLSKSQVTDASPLDSIDDNIEEQKALLKYKNQEVKEVKKELKQRVKNIKDECKGLKKAERSDCLERIEGVIAEATAGVEQVAIPNIKQEVKELKDAIKDLRKQKTNIKKDLKEDPSQYGVLMAKCVKKVKKEKKSKKDIEEEQSDLSASNVSNKSAHA
jgi:superfamily II DNA or RNA helicase